MIRPPARPPLGWHINKIANSYPFFSQKISKSCVSSTKWRVLSTNSGVSNTQSRVATRFPRLTSHLFPIFPSPPRTRPLVVMALISIVPGYISPLPSLDIPPLPSLPLELVRGPGRRRAHLHRARLHLAFGRRVVRQWRHRDLLHAADVRDVDQVGEDRLALLVDHVLARLLLHGEWAMTRTMTVDDDAVGGRWRGRWTMTRSVDDDSGRWRGQWTMTRSVNDDAVGGRWRGRWTMTVGDDMVSGGWRGQWTMTVGEDVVSGQWYGEWAMTWWVDDDAVAGRWHARCHVSLSWWRVLGVMTNNTLNYRCIAIVDATIVCFPIDNYRR